MGGGRKRTSSPIARRLRAARLQTGLSQRRVGIKAGLDETVASARMNQYERGVHQPIFEMLSKLSEVLGQPEPYFFAREDDLAELISTYGRLAPSDQKLLRKMASALTAKSGTRPK